MTGPTGPTGALEDSWAWRITNAIFRSSLTALFIGGAIAVWGVTPHPVHLTAHVDEGGTVEVYNQGGPDVSIDSGVYTPTDLDVTLPWTPFRGGWKIQVTTTTEGPAGWCKVDSGQEFRIDTPGGVSCFTPLSG